MYLLPLCYDLLNQLLLLERCVAVPRGVMFVRSAERVHEVPQLVPWVAQPHLLGFVLFGFLRNGETRAHILQGTCDREDQ